MTELISHQRAAEILGVTRQSVHNLVSQSHRLTPYGGRPAQVSLDEVLEYAAVRRQRRQGATKPPLVPGDGDPRHGVSGYSSQGCRCPICREAAAVARRKRYAEPRTLPEGDPRHGTVTARGYWRCKCNICVPSRLIKPPKLIKPLPAPEYISGKAAAVILGISPQEVCYLAATGRLTRHRFPESRYPSRAWYLETEVTELLVAEAQRKLDREKARAEAAAVKEKARAEVAAVKAAAKEEARAEAAMRRAARAEAAAARRTARIEAAAMRKRQLAEDRFTARVIRILAATRAVEEQAAREAEEWCAAATEVVETLGDTWLTRYRIRSARNPGALIEPERREM